MQNNNKSRKSIVGFAAADDHHHHYGHQQQQSFSPPSSSRRGTMNGPSSSISPHILQQRAQMSLLRRKLLPVIGLRRFQHARRTQRENILASIMEQHQYNQKVLAMKRQQQQELLQQQQQQEGATKTAGSEEISLAAVTPGTEEQNNKTNNKTFLTETNNTNNNNPLQALGSRPATGDVAGDPLAVLRPATTNRISNLIIQHSTYLKHWGKSVLEELLSSDRAALERFALAEETLTYPSETCFSHGLIVLVHGTLLKIPRPSDTVMKQHYNHLAQQSVSLEDSLNPASSMMNSSTSASASASSRKKTTTMSTSMLLQRSPLNLTNTNPDAHVIKAPAVIGEELILAEGISDYFLKAETYCQYIFISSKEIHKKLLELPRATIAKTLPPEILVSREVTLRQHFKQTPPLLRCSWITKDMEPKTLYRLMLDLEAKSFLPGEDIAKEGSVAPWMVFIRRGEADLMAGEVVVMKLKPGDTFGEMSVLFGEPRLNTLRSTTICDVWVLHRRSVGNILRMADSQRSVVRKAAKMRRVLLEQLPRVHSHAPLREQVPYLRGMPDPIFEKMVNNSKAHVFPVGLLMVASSETCDALVVIVQGSCVSQDARHVRYHGGDVLGANCLIPHRWTHGISATTMVDSFILARPHLAEALRAWGEYDTAMRYVKLEMRELKRSLTKELLLNPPPSNIATSTVMHRTALKSVLDGDYGSTSAVLFASSSRRGRSSTNNGMRDDSDEGDDNSTTTNNNNNGSRAASSSPSQASNSRPSSSSAASASLKNRNSNKYLTQEEKLDQKRIAIKKQRFKVRVHKGFKTMIGGNSSSSESDHDDDNYDDYNRGTNKKKLKSNKAFRREQSLLRQHHHHHHSGNPFKNQITELVASQRLGTALHHHPSSAAFANVTTTNNNNNNNNTAVGSTNNNIVNTTNQTTRNSSASTSTTSPARRQLPPISTATVLSNNNSFSHSESKAGGILSPTSSVNSASFISQQQQQQQQQQNASSSSPPLFLSSSSNASPNNNNNRNESSPSTSNNSPKLNAAASSSSTGATSTKPVVRSTRKIQEMYQNPEQYRDQLQKQRGQRDLPKSMLKEVQSIELENQIREKSLQKRKLKQQQLSLMNMMMKEEQNQNHHHQQQQHAKDSHSLAQEDALLDQQEAMLMMERNNNNNNNQNQTQGNNATNISGNNNNNNNNTNNSNSNSAGISFVDIDDDHHLGVLKIIWSNPRYDFVFSDRQDIAKVIAPWPSVTHVYWLNQKLRDEDPNQREKRKLAAASIREQMLQEALDSASSKRLDLQRYSISLPSKLIDQQKEFEGSRTERQNETNERARRLSMAIMQQPPPQGSLDGSGGISVMKGSPVLMSSDPSSSSATLLSSSKSPNSGSMSGGAILTGLSLKARRRSSIASVEQAELLMRRNSESNYNNNRSSFRSAIKGQQQESEPGSSGGAVVAVGIVSGIERTDSMGVHDDDGESLNNTGSFQQKQQDQTTTTAAAAGALTSSRTNSLRLQQQPQQQHPLLASKYGGGGGGDNNNSSSSAFGSGRHLYQSNSFYGANNYSYQNYYNKSNLAYTSARQDEPPPLVTPQEVEMILGGLLASVPARVRQQFEFDDIGEEGPRVGGVSSSSSAVAAASTHHRTNASSNSRWVPSDMNRDFLMEEIEDLSLNIDSSLPQPRHFAIYDSEESVKIPTTRHFRQWVNESVKMRIRAAKDKARKQYEIDKIERRKRMVAIGMDESAIREDEANEDEEHAFLYTEMTDEEWDAILLQSGTSATSSVSLAQLLEDPEYYLDKKRRRERDIHSRTEVEKKLKLEQEEARLQKEREEQERLQLLQQQKNKQNVPSYARGTAATMAKSKNSGTNPMLGSNANGTSAATNNNNNTGNNDGVALVMMSSSHHHHNNNNGSNYSSSSEPGEGRFSLKAILEEREKQNPNKKANDNNNDSNNNNNNKNRGRESVATGTTTTASGDRAGAELLSEEERIAREKRREAGRLKRKEKRDRRRSRQERRARGEENVSDTTVSDDSSDEESKEQHKAANHLKRKGSMLSSTNSAILSKSDDAVKNNAQNHDAADDDYDDGNGAEDGKRADQTRGKAAAKTPLVLQPQPPKTARGRRLAARLIIPNNNNNNNSSTTQQEQQEQQTVEKTSNNSMSVNARTARPSTNNNNNNKPSSSLSTSSPAATVPLFKSLESTFIKRPLEKNSNYIRTAKPKHSARLGWAMVPANPPPRNEKMETSTSISISHISEKKQQQQQQKIESGNGNEDEDNEIEGVRPARDSKSNSRGGGSGGAVNNKDDNDDYYAILKNTHPGRRQVPPSPTRSVSTASESTVSNDEDDEEIPRNDEQEEEM